MDFRFCRGAAILFWAMGAAQAHELDVMVRMAPPAVVLRAVYGGTEPVPFAKVRVFAAGEPRAEYQMGFTDRNGAFSFVPDAGGPWRVVIDDETGHRREVAVSVPPRFTDGGATGSVGVGASRLERALLGVALLVGITGFWYGWKARRAPVSGVGRRAP